MDSNFASTKYAEKIASVRNSGYQQPDFKDLRARTVAYIERFDPQSWYTDPVRTLLLGKPLVATDDKNVSTVDAFNKKNGSMLHSSRPALDLVYAHLRSFQGLKDYRDKVRAIEAELLSNDLAAQLVGNQSLDFHKQDGITEIEEAHLANIVERGLNDLLLADEIKGTVQINRAPAWVGAVSNFSNFLDLFRKTIRNIELGVPVVVLSRNNTTQHVFRWTCLLLDLMEKHGVDLGLVTFVSCDIENQRALMQAFPASPMYFTGSRPIAKLIKEVCPSLMASTGGPNTLLSTVLNPSIDQAIVMSAAIENSGQCTALRHVVLPPSPNFAPHVVGVWDGVACQGKAQDALAQSSFCSLLEGAPFKVAEGYTAHPTKPVAYRIQDQLGGELDEHWREVYVDYTQSAINDELVEKLSTWLTTHQPISLAVNGDTYEEAYGLAKKLFERTALVVYTVGSTENPALTCQARPQDGEVFGEFPPRRDLSLYSKYPVIVPSSTPGYNASYSRGFLQQNDVSSIISAQLSLWAGHSNQHSQALLEQIASVEFRAYGRLLAAYLQDALHENPKRGHGSRTALWGLQNVPHGRHTLIRLGSMDLTLVTLLPFHMTNAHTRVRVSLPSSATKAQAALTKLGIAFAEHDTKDQFAQAASLPDVWGVIDLSAASEDAFDFPLVGHFVSQLLPLGHIKCTKGQDEKFVEVFKSSEKWLQLRE